MERFIDVVSKKRAEAYGFLKEDNLTVLNKYLNNIKVSESFYPLLDFFEISLRNRINNVFIDDYGEDWLLDNDFFDVDTQRAVSEVQERLSKKKKYPVNHRLVAELNFGFWSNLFNKKYHVVWQQNKRIPRAFINAKLDIKTINKELEILRNFRNRVFHFETIYNHNPERCYGLLLKYISAMTPNDDFMNIVKELDRANEILFDKIDTTVK